MATVHEGARKDAPEAEAYVVCTELDWCWTPVGDDQVLVGYSIAAYFTDAVQTTPTVTMTSQESFNAGSRISRVFGDEAGTGGGVQSGVNLGYCRPDTYSDTVFAEGKQVVNDGAVFLMNCNGPDGPHNTVGELIYLEGGAAIPLGPQTAAVEAPAAAAEPGETWGQTASRWWDNTLWLAAQPFDFLVAVPQGAWGTVVMFAEVPVFIYDLSFVSGYLTPDRYTAAVDAWGHWVDAAGSVAVDGFNDPLLALSAAGSGLASAGSGVGGAFAAEPGRVLGELVGGAAMGGYTLSLAKAPVQTLKATVQKPAGFVHNVYREALWRGMGHPMPPTVQQVQVLQGLMPSLLAGSEARLRDLLAQLKGVEDQINLLDGMAPRGAQLHKLAVERKPELLAKQADLQKKVASETRNLESLKVKEAQLPKDLANAQAAAAAEKSAVRVLLTTRKLPKPPPMSPPAVGAAMGGTPDEIARRIATQLQLSPAEHARLLESLRSGMIPGDTVLYMQNTVGDPVSVATGAVVDHCVDLLVPGPLPIAWSRTFCSSRGDGGAGDHGPGWSHAFEQVLLLREDGVTLRDHDGRSIFFPPLAIGESFFHRAERLTLERRDEGFLLHTTPRRTTRTFTRSSRPDLYLLRALSDAHGNALSIEHDAEDGLAAIDNGAGRGLRVHRAGGRATRVEVIVDGQPVTGVDFSYSDDGRLTGVSDALGVGHRYEHDTRGRVSAITRPGGARFTYRHDAAGRCAHTTGPDGLLEAWLVFDGEGRTTRVGGAERREHTWNEIGLVVRERTFEGEVLVERDYDRGLLAAERSGGRRLRYDRDERDRITRAVVEGGGQITIAYDDDGHPSRIEGPGSSLLELAHDARGELVRVRGPGRRALHFVRDERGQLLEVRDDEGCLRAYRHDERGDLVATTGAAGDTVTCTRDALGRVTALVDAEGAATRLRLDDRGRPLEIVGRDGAVRRVAWTALDMPATIEDPLGQITRFEYTVGGRVSRVTSPGGRSWSFEYTPAERLCRAVNPRGESHRFTHDDAGRLVEETTLDGRVFEYRHEGTRLVAVQHPDGTSAELVHDASGHVVEERRPDMVITYRRDPAGRLLEAAVEEAGRRTVTRREWDPEGRLVAEEIDGRRVTFTLDRRGLCVARTLPGGATTQYGYDPSGALTRVEIRGRELLIERDRAGREIERRFAGGAVVVRSERDVAGRLTRQTAAGPSGRVLARRSYTHDALGRPVEIADLRAGTTRYRYDHERLVEARSDTRTETLAYDRAGDLRGRDGVRWTVRRGQVRRAGAVRFEHDARGRRTARIEASPTGDVLVTRYVWDSRDRLREAHLPDGRRIAFHHEALGRCVRREVHAPGGSELLAVTEYVWDGDQLAAETSAELGAREIVHEPGTFFPVIQVQGGRVLACLTDAIGTPKELFDEAGELVWAAAHGVWGDIVAVSGAPRSAEPAGSSRAPAFECPLRLLGQSYDPDLNLCRTLHRWFDPSVARWLTPDPLGLAGGTSPFGFDGVPTTDADPLGLALVFSMTDNVHRIWESQRFLGMTEGAAYGMKEAWASAAKTMIDAKGLDPGMIVFNGDAARLFHLHRPTGPYSLMKMMKGQYKAPFGDVHFLDAQMGTAFNTQLNRMVPTIVVNSAEMVPHMAQSTNWARARLAGRAAVLEPVIMGGAIFGSETIRWKLLELVGP